MPNQPQQRSLVVPTTFYQNQDLPKYVRPKSANVIRPKSAASRRINSAMNQNNNQVAMIRPWSASRAVHPAAHLPPKSTSSRRGSMVSTSSQVSRISRASSRASSRAGSHSKISKVWSEEYSPVLETRHVQLQDADSVSETWKGDEEDWSEEEDGEMNDPETTTLI